MGEGVTFHPVGGGASRTFPAVVNRDRLQQIGRNQDLGTAAREATVFLPYSATATEGVVTVADGDELTLPLQLGQPAVRCRILETLSEDEGGFLVRVQR